MTSFRAFGADGDLPPLGHTDRFSQRDGSRNQVLQGRRYRLGR